MEKLCVLANEFPYGNWEPYMETEEKFYIGFEKIWIASLQLRKNHATTIRKLQCNAKIIPVMYRSRWFYLINSLTVLLDINLYKEIRELKKSKRLNISRIIKLFVFLSRAHHEARVINRTLKSETKKDIILYSYRFEYQPYVAIILKNKWKENNKIICRAHRYDLYEEEHANHYIPLRNIILKNINRVHPCSEHGVNYIKEKYDTSRVIVSVKYLGTNDNGEKQYNQDSTTYSIVSCSNVIEIKRIYKIVNALSMINDININWTHYGNGLLLKQIKEIARKKLKNNIQYTFPGNIPNKKLFEEYSNKNFYLFLNVSSSEGIPVSIMEAQSFGIPCIATNVGGTSEVVDEKSGILLPENVSDEELAKTIHSMCLMKKKEYLKLRKSTRMSWEVKFNAQINYSKFIQELI